MHIHTLILLMLCSFNIYAMELQPILKKAKTLLFQDEPPMVSAVSDSLDSGLAAESFSKKTKTEECQGTDEATHTTSAEPTFKKPKTDVVIMSAREFIKLGEKYTNEGKWQDAVDSYTSVLSGESKPLEQYLALKNLGILHTLNGTCSFPGSTNTPKSTAVAVEYFDKAVARFTQALKIGPLPQKNIHEELCELYTFFTIACKESYQLEKAIACAKSGLNYAPNHSTRISLFTILGQSYRPYDIESSEKYLKLGLNEAMLLAKATYIDVCNYNGILASLYKELGNTQMLKYKKNDVNGDNALIQAETYYTRSLILNNGLKHRSGIWVQMALIYKKRGLTQDAHHLLKLASELPVKNVNPIAHAAAVNLLGKLG